MTTQKPVSEQDINNTKHTLELLAKQVRSGRVEEDFALRQIEKVKELEREVAAASRTAGTGVAFQEWTRVRRYLADVRTALRVIGAKEAPPQPPPPPEHD